MERNKGIWHFLAKLRYYIKNNHQVNTVTADTHHTIHSREVNGNPSADLRRNNRQHLRLLSLIYVCNLHVICGPYNTVESSLFQQIIINTLTVPRETKRLFASQVLWEIHRVFPVSQLFLDQDNGVFTLHTPYSQKVQLWFGTIVHSLNKRNISCSWSNNAICFISSLRWHGRPGELARCRIRTLPPQRALIPTLTSALSQGDADSLRVSKDRA